MEVKSNFQFVKLLLNSFGLLAETEFLIKILILERVK